MSFSRSRRSSMSFLADEINDQIRIWENYHNESGISLPSFHSDDCTPVLSPQTPRLVLDARDEIVDSALKLLHLAAGPSKIISIALCYSQTLSAIKWLLHFKIFDLVPEEAMAYDELAESASVPIFELKRMIRLAITSHIFSEPDEGFVKHTPFSRAFAHDENLRRGIPFFCDAVMPAAAKMTDATTRWPDSEESDETARNIALDDDMIFAQYLTEHNQADGYASLMRLLGSEPDQQAVCLADIVHGYTWSDLEENSLVVDLGCGPYSWGLAKLFPHLRFQVQGPQDKLSTMKNNFMSIENPGLLTRIDFCPHDFHDEQITHDARVYLLPGILRHLPGREVTNILEKIADVMALGSEIVIADSILPEVGNESLATQMESRCRDMTIRQLHNSGDRTLRELGELVASTGHNLAVEGANCLPGSMVTTVILEKYRRSMYDSL